MAIDREQIIGKRVPVPVVPLPGTSLGPDLCIRMLPPQEVNLWEKIRTENNGNPLNGDARLFVLVASDAIGNRLFTDADAEYFGNEAGHAQAVRVALQVAIEFNTITDADVEAAKKNLSATGNASSLSSLPTG